MDDISTKYRNAGFTWLIMNAHNYYTGGQEIPVTESMMKFKSDLLRSQDPYQILIEYFEPLYSDDIGTKTAVERREWLCIDHFVDKLKDISDIRDVNTTSFSKKLMKLFPLNVKCDQTIQGPKGTKRAKRLFAYKPIQMNLESLV